MRPRYVAPLITFAALLVIYSLTLAPGVTLWDSGEFLAAVKTLGIPHPAGTPLFILIAKCWSLLFAPIFGFARAVNLLSAVATAAACALIASLFGRWTHDAAAGICAGLISGTMSTIWLSATETEVYALAFLLGCILLWAADRCGRTGESRWALLVVYLAGLAWSLHLATLVVLPAAALLLFSERDGSFDCRADGEVITGAARINRRFVWRSSVSCSSSPARAASPSCSSARGTIRGSIREIPRRWHRSGM